ncbi:complement factor H-related protein 1-like [Sylvia atricapilla]|uniref:complement factor H-related protein 1-like n=1 Tax=Sylvia atricapilla TaxID=48155 RepID=UPI003393C139
MSRYNPGESAKYQCWKSFKMTGDSTVVCQNGTWTELPTCKGKAGICGTPPAIQNGELLIFPLPEYQHGDTLEYQCPDFYVLEGSPTITCLNGQWTDPPVCLAACTVSEEDMDRNNIELKWVVKRKVYITSGDYAEFRCKQGFLEDPSTSSFRVQCVEGTLKYPRCPLRDVTCGPPPEIAGGRIAGTKMSRYNPGESAKYQCWKSFKMTGDSTVVCQNGTWTELPTCKGKAGICGTPPAIQNGELLIFPLPEYQHGDTLEYQCPDFYILEGSRTITCLNGQWTDPPVCLASCTVSEEDMDRNNIELKWVVIRKLLISSGGYIEFRCKLGYLEDPSTSSFRVQCVDGTLKYPRCTLGRSCALDRITMERNHIQLQSSRQLSHHYHSGAPVVFVCKPGYRQVVPRDDFIAQCLDGVIKYPKCEDSPWFG